MIKRYTQPIDKLIKENIDSSTSIVPNGGVFIVCVDDAAKLPLLMDYVDASMDAFPSFIKEFKLLTYNSDQLDYMCSTIKNRVLAKSLSEELSDTLNEPKRKNKI